MEQTDLLTELNNFLNRIIDARVNAGLTAVTTELNQRITDLGDQILRLKHEGVGLTEQKVEEMIEEAFDEHNREYDHDEFISDISMSDVEDAVSDCVNNLTFEVRVS